MPNRPLKVRASEAPRPLAALTLALVTLLAATSVNAKSYGVLIQGSSEKPDATFKFERVVDLSQSSPATGYAEVLLLVEDDLSAAHRVGGADIRVTQPDGSWRHFDYMPIVNGMSADIRHGIAVLNGAATEAPSQAMPALSDATDSQTIKVGSLVCFMTPFDGALLNKRNERKPVHGNAMLMGIVQKMERSRIQVTAWGTTVFDSSGMPAGMLDVFQVPGHPNFVKHQTYWVDPQGWEACP